MKELKPLGKGSLTSKVIKAMGKSSGFESPLPSLKKKLTSVSAYHEPYDIQREFKNALLEVEKHRVHDIMEIQRRTSFR